MTMEPASGAWHFMQDGVAFGMFNHQGGQRGGNEFRMPNWWMGMFTRRVASGQFGVNTMFSLDPVTVGEQGYRELFQTGEAIDGHPFVDRQHPHDAFMQLAATWSILVTDRTSLRFAAGPVGEPALGPVAFMHRASAAENPLAPLSHHTFDSTHVAFGVVTAGLDHGRWSLEGSIFNGREPDQHRWDFDFGRLDSFSGRLWYRPARSWELQISSGRLTDPETLEPGNIVRTTVSGSWLKSAGSDYEALTVAYGQNDKTDGTQHSFLAEATKHLGRGSAFMRVEIHDVESSALAPTDEILSRMAAVSMGGTWDVLRRAGYEGAVGASVTFYRTPTVLKPSYGPDPVSAQIFFRLRPPAGSMGRMWNMRMSQPMKPAPSGEMMNHQMN